MQVAENQTVPLELHQSTLARLAHVEAQLAWFQRQIFGVKSERFVPTIPGQLSLPFGGEEPQLTEEAIKQVVGEHEREKPKSKHQGREVIPAHLPRVTEVVEPQEDTSGMTRIGEDVTETYEYVAGKFWVRQVIRPRYAYTEAQQAEFILLEQSKVPSAIIQAPALDVPFPKVKAGVSLLSHIVVSKYVDHLPLYRILGQFAREGIKIPDSTIGEWVKIVANRLELLYESYKQLIFRSTYLQMDETTLKVLEDGKGKCHLGYLWAAYDPVNKLPFFFYQKGRDHKGPKQLLEHFVGYLQCDGYTVYETLSKSMETMQLVNCMAHIRREFFEAKDNDSERATTALFMINALYKIEQSAREQQLSHEERLALRQKDAKIIFETFEQWLNQEYPKVLPKSKIGQAIAYALRRCKNMAFYLIDGKLEIDNNFVENNIRPAAIGRKNYLFAGSHEAAQRTALFYTFFAACKHHNINPYEWLDDVLGRIHLHHINKIDELLPHKWTKI
jgi:transposase